MKRWANRVAVVTGANSGIGQAIAKDLVTEGLRVVALDIQLERIEKNRFELPDNVKALYFPQKCDVTNKDDVNATFKWIETTLGGTDILINSAGIYKLGNLVDMDLGVIDDTINTNMRGLVYCTQAAYRSMKSREFDGHIVHINSINGHIVPDTVGGMSTNIYTPTKFAVTAITEVMRKELIRLETKIKTTSISPGLTRTRLVPNAVFDAIGVCLKPEDISRAVVFAISTPPHVQIHNIIVKPVGEEF